MHRTKEVAFADDFTIAGKISEFKEYWEELRKIGPKYGYFPKASKSHLIVKAQYEQEAKDTFTGSNVNVSTSGQRHLGAVIEHETYKETYVEQLVEDWKQQLEIFSKIAEIEPQAAYTAFVFGFRTYFIRKIPNLEILLAPIEETIPFKLIPALTNGHQCSDIEIKLLSLPARHGGLGITNFTETSSIEYENSRKITSALSQSIIDQHVEYNVNMEGDQKNQKRNQAR